MSSTDSLEGTAGPRVLVVGNTPAGMVLAGTLARRGADPTLLDQRAGPTPKERVFVHPPGLTVLERLGVDDRIREASDSLAWLRAGVGERATAPTVSIRRDTLVRSLSRLAPENTSLDASVAGTEDLGDGVRVTFDDGLREGFDAVVGADGPTSAIRALAGGFGDAGSPLHEWSFVVDRDGTAPQSFEEVWTDDGFAAVTTSAGTTAVRVVVRPDDVVAPHHEGALRAAARSVGGSVPPLVDRLGDQSPWYRRIGVSSGRAVVHDGRVALCGTAARPAGFATALEPTLGIVDAWTLAVDLARADDPGRALARYGSRRSGETGGVSRALTAGLTADGRGPADPAHPFDAVRALRAIALGPGPNDGTAGRTVGRSGAG